MTDNKNYNDYVILSQKAADLSYAAAVLEWDQEVYMPPKGATIRGRQLATLATQAHELYTGARMKELVNALITDETLDEDQRANVKRSHEDMTKNAKLSPEFVEKLTLQTSECFNAWIDARKHNDFQLFAPSLARMVELKKQQARLFGHGAHPYDALLDEYEKGATVAMLDKVFQGIKEVFPAILDKIKEAPQVANDFFYLQYPREQQWDFSMEVLQKMGYDFEAGRQDYAAHPFTTSFSPSDVRITTRVNEHDFPSLLWSSIHEGGHALYEQGLPEEQYGLPLGSAASLGIHESQSRLWENSIGRSLGYWQYFYPRLQQFFPQALGTVSLSDFYKATNKVQPSFIRTESDEITYHFHVLIRYELEKRLLEETLEVADLPQAWNELYQKYLGITPPDDNSGVLQDVHWSHGSFGYFPTYTLGSFYAAQIYAAALAAIPGLEEQVKSGNTTLLLAWLRTHIHQHGRKYTSEELCERATGARLDSAYFIRYAREKYEGIYNIKFDS